MNDIFLRIDLLFWRTIKAMLNAGWFKVIYMVLYVLFIMPFTLMSNPPRFVRTLHLASMRKKVIDKLDDFNAHSQSWNQKKLANKAAAVQKIVELSAGYRGSLSSDEDFLKEKQRLVDSMAADLAGRVDAGKINDPGARRDELTAALAALDANLQHHAMALSMEGLRRKTNGYINLYDKQIISALLLSDNYFVELRNGEGKTYVTIPTLAWAAMKVEALRLFCAQRAIDPPFDKVLYFTSNDYLVRRDFVRLKKVFELLGITISYLQRTVNNREIRRLRYSADILMIEGTDYGFDFLRNTSREYQKAPIEPSPYFALIDEADQLLIDEARTPLILSGESQFRQSNFVEVAWVRQINNWINEVFAPNVLVEQRSPAVWGLNNAGALYFRSVLKEMQVEDWEAFAEFIKKKDYHIMLEAILAVMLNEERHRALVDPVLRNSLLAELNDSRTKLISRRADGTYQVSQQQLYSIMSNIESKDMLAIMNETVRIFARGQSIATFSPEEFHFFKTYLKKRKFLTLFAKILTNKSYFVKMFELYVNALADRIRKINFSRQFVQGLISVYRQEKGLAPQSDNKAMPFPNWAVLHGIPDTLNLLIPVVEKFSVSPDNLQDGVEKDMVILTRSIKLITSKIIDYQDSEIIKKAIQDYSLLGNLYKATLYMPVTGNLTAAGLRVAQYLEEICVEKGLTENYSRGGITQLIQTGLNAYFTYRQGVQYSIKDNRVMLINQINGRPEESKQFGRFLHPFIQAKHGLKIEEPNPVIRTITIQSLIERIPGVVGMSGTILSEEAELRKIYPRGFGSKEPSVVKVPPRIDPYAAKLLTFDPLLLALRESFKIEKIVEHILEERLSRHNRQPILIITSSVELSESIAQRLQENIDAYGADLTFNILNALNIEREEEIVSFAGQPGAITIATQMAARGTDIIIPKSSVELGGLYVLISETHENERLDTQAEGRAARHGDPGRVKYFMSLEDKMAEKLGIRTLTDRFPNFYKEFIRDGFIDDMPLQMIKSNLEEHRTYFKKLESSKVEYQANVDLIVNSYRQIAYDIREQFVVGAPETIESGIRKTIDLMKQQLASFSSLRSYQALADRLAQDITRSTVSTDDLISLAEENLGFPIIRNEMAAVVRAYQRQMSPFIKLSPDKKSIPLREAVLRAIIASALLQDKKTIDQEWRDIDREFNISSAFSPKELSRMFSAINARLHLGLTPQAEDAAFKYIQKQLKPDRVGKQKWGALIRKSVLAAFSDVDTYLLYYRNYEKEITDVQKTTLSQSADALLDAEFSRQLKENRRDREQFCEEVIRVFDHAFEKLNDEVNIASTRISQMGLGFKEWVYLLQEIRELMDKKMFSLASEVMKIILQFDFSPKPGLIAVHSERRFEVGALGSPWFMDETELLEEDVLRQVELPESDDEDDEYFQNIHTSVTQSMRKNAAKLDRAADKYGNIYHLRPGQIRITIKDLHYYLFDLSEKQSSESALRESRFLLENKGDGLSAVAILDNAAEEDSKNSFLRARVFGDFGCVESEFKYLRKLRLEKALSTRLLLRFTYLLSRVGDDEKNIAKAILLKESVPDFDTIDPDKLDYTPINAFRTALEQLFNMQGYDEVIELYLANLHILELEYDHPYLQSYLIVAESLLRSSESCKADFQAVSGISWREWLINLFSDLYAEYENAEEWYQNDPRFKRYYMRGLLKISLFAEQAEYALAIAHKVLHEEEDATRWFFLSEIFKEAGYLYEARLCSARYYLSMELYEEALETTATLLPESAEPDPEVDPEVDILRIYALINLVRCLSRDLYGKKLADEYVKEALGLINRLPEEEQQKEYAVEKKLACLCHMERYAEAKDLLVQHNVHSSRWRIRALVAPRLGSVKATEDLLFLLDEIQPNSETEHLECLVLFNDWLQRQKSLDNPALHAHLADQYLGLLFERMSASLADMSHYKVSWELGKLLNLRGEQLLKNDRKGAMALLNASVEEWRNALQLTYVSEDDLTSVLKRHEELAREIIEEDLRQTLQEIKKLEKEAAHVEA